MKILIISVIVVFVLLIGFIAGAIAYKTPEEKAYEDIEQIEYLRKWREERDNKQSVSSKGKKNE